MEATYYKPDISEFHVGFECEIRQDKEDGFSNAICYLFSVSDMGNSLTTLSAIATRGNVIKFSLCPFSCDLEGFVRVKHLDEQDILSEGWQYQGSDAGMKNYLKGEYWLQQYEDSGVIITQGDGFDFTDDDVIFNGEMKNLSELRFQQKRLGIK